MTPKTKQNKTKQILWNMCNNWVCACVYHTHTRPHTFTHSWLLYKMLNLNLKNPFEIDKQKRTERKTTKLEIDRTGTEHKTINDNKEMYGATTKFSTIIAKCTMSTVEISDLFFYIFFFVSCCCLINHGYGI